MKNDWQAMGDDWSLIDADIYIIVLMNSPGWASKLCLYLLQKLYYYCCSCKLLLLVVISPYHKLPYTLFTFKKHIPNNLYMCNKNIQIIPQYCSFFVTKKVLPIFNTQYCLLLLHNIVYIYYTVLTSYYTVLFSLFLVLSVNITQYCLYTLHSTAYIYYTVLSISITQYCLYYTVLSISITQYCLYLVHSTIHIYYTVLYDILHLPITQIYKWLVVVIFILRYSLGIRQCLFTVYMYKQLVDSDVNIPLSSL